MLERLVPVLLFLLIGLIVLLVFAALVEVRRQSQPKLRRTHQRRLSRPPVNLQLAVLSLMLIPTIAQSIIAVTAISVTPAYLVAIALTS